jgi:hypothetical protein
MSTARKKRRKLMGDLKEWVKEGQRSHPASMSPHSRMRREQRALSSSLIS